MAGDRAGILKGWKTRRTDPRLIKIAEIFAAEEKPKSFAAALRAAGYLGYIGKPHSMRARKSYQKIMKPILEKFKEARDQALERMEETVRKTDYASAAGGMEKLQKQIQLIEGKNTENIGMNHFETLTDGELYGLLRKKMDSCKSEETRPDVGIDKGKTS